MSEELEIRKIKGSKGYYIGSDGIVYRDLLGLARVTGWINKTRSGQYRRCYIAYEDGTNKDEYNHMLVSIAFHGGDRRSEGLLVCHGPMGCMDNSRENTGWGTHKKNQNEDRKRDGNYHKRGPQKEDIEECPF